MREELQKLADGIAKAAQMLKEDKTSEAIESLEATTEAINELGTQIDSAEANATELEEVQKKLAEKDVEIAKYANLNISTDTLEQIIVQVKELTDMLAPMTDIMKATSTKDDVKLLGDRIETLEKATYSRQLLEENANNMKKSALSSLDFTPRS